MLLTFFLINDSVSHMKNLLNNIGFKKERAQLQQSNEPFQGQRDVQFTTSHSSSLLNISFADWKTTTTTYIYTKFP